MKTKHPIKIGHKIFPTGTDVRPATLEEAQKIWPGITANQSSNQLMVWFPDVKTPIIVHKSQIV